jgi:UDP-D-galactose:(glucosyl)LPS alpha-1,6-D-galactosyltransferase
MKILFLISSKGNGGLEKILEIFSCYMNKKGHEVVYLNLYTPQDYFNIKQTGVFWPPFNNAQNKIYIKISREYPTKKPFLKIILNSVLVKTKYYGFREVLEIIENERNINFILVENPLWLLGVKRAVRESRSNAITILWNHGSINVKREFIETAEYVKQRILNNILLKWTKHADYVFAISTGIAQKLAKYNGEEKIKIVYNPIASSAPVKIIGKPKEGNIFIYIGRLDDTQKNITFLFEALSRFYEKQWILKVIGEGPDEQKLKDIAKKYKINNQVEFLGFQDRPYDLIDKATCLILTSRYEGFPSVLVEAIERGLPVLSSNCETGPRDIVKQGVNGYLYKPGDKKQFYKYLMKIIRGDFSVARSEMRNTVAKYREKVVMSNIERALHVILEKHHYV